MKLKVIASKKYLKGVFSVRSMQITRRGGIMDGGLQTLLKGQLYYMSYRSFFVGIFLLLIDYSTANARGGGILGRVVDEAG